MHRYLPKSPGNWICLLAAAAVALPAAMQSQLPTPQTQLVVGPTYTSADGFANPRFPNIDLVFVVRRPDGVAYPVNAPDLKLFSEGVEAGTARSIRPFAATGYGMTTVLALDTGSLTGSPKEIQAALTHFFSDSRPQDRFALASLGDKVQVLAPFGAQSAVALESLKQAASSAPLSAAHQPAIHLFDSLFDALSLFTNAQPRRRQVLLVSNGRDLNSRHTLIDLLLKAKSMGIEIDCLVPGTPSASGLEVLEQAAAETGGALIPVPSAAAFDATLQQILIANLATPVAAFQLTHVPADGEVHSLQLRWRPGNLTAPAFLKTPPQSSLGAPLPNSFSDYLSGHFDDLWPWVLGACFLVGLLLLVFSLRKPKPAPEPVGSANPARNPQPNPVPSPAAHPMQQRDSRIANQGIAPPGSARIITGQHRQSIARSFTIAESDAVPALFPAPPQGPFAQLQMTQGELAGRRVPMTMPTFSVGASASNHLVLTADPTLSGKHIHLLWQTATLKIEDRNSTNGTFLNAKRLTPGQHLLRPGDEIRIGRVVFLVQRT